VHGIRGAGARGTRASPADASVATEAAAAAGPGPPADGGHIPSAEPATTKTPDGWTLTISSRDETLLPVPPLTTALSSRDYVVGGIYSGSLIGPELPRGVLEVGYQIGCGVDMSTSNGVTLVGTTGVTGSVGTTGPLVGVPTGLLPIVPVPATGGISVSLKPGLVNIVPVDKKEFRGPEPWIMIANFHVKIDGCVGESFIRSYATLTRQTEQSDVVLSWLGTTRTV
jgi:MspA